MRGPGENNNKQKHKNNKETHSPTGAPYENEKKKLQQRPQPSHTVPFMWATSTELHVMIIVLMVVQADDVCNTIIIGGIVP